MLRWVCQVWKCVEKLCNAGRVWEEFANAPDIVALMTHFLQFCDALVTLLYLAMEAFLQLHHTAL
jgi:hypothetical protein